LNSKKQKKVYENILIPLIKTIVQEITEGLFGSSVSKGGLA